MENSTGKNEGVHGSGCMGIRPLPEKKDGEDEFRHAREEWKKEEQEYKSMGLESAGEVIDAIAKAMEAAEKAATHMDGNAMDGENMASLVL